MIVRGGWVAVLRLGGFRGLNSSVDKHISHACCAPYLVGMVVAPMGGVG